MNIRRATASDRVTISSFQDKLVMYERPFDSRIKDGKVAYYNIQKLLGSRNSYVAVAEEGGVLIGCGFGEILREQKWCRNSRFGYVGLMYVDENSRGKGVGKKLLTSIISWFKTKNIHEIRLKVYSENVNAIRAYANNGFKEFVKEMRLDISRSSRTF